MAYDKQAGFESMVRAYSGDLYRLAWWLCRERAQAEDLVQETFARAWKALDTLEDEKAVKGWLFTILRHEHARLFERKRVETVEMDLDQFADQQQANPGLSIDLRQALGRLPESHRAPLILQVLHGFSAREIGAILAVAEGSVMTRLTRARQAMRRLLEGDSPTRKVAKS